MIRIRASGVCFTDIHLAQGKIVPVSFPAVLGHEPAGEVVELGSAVTTVQVGDRVGTNTLQRGCGRCEANPLPADRIAVVGLGGLGHLAVQYAKAAGHTVIAVTQSVDKRKLGIDLGADEVVRSGEQLKQAGGADVILSTANSYSVAVDAMSGLRPEGRLVIMGVQEEDMVLPEKLVFPQMIVNRQKIIASQHNGPEVQHEALQIAAAGKVKVMTEEYKFTEVGRAVERVAEGKTRFRAVLVNPD